MTLRELIEEHPEWADLPLVWSDPQDGHVEFVGANGSASIMDQRHCDIHEEHGISTCDTDTCPTGYPIVAIEGN